jgi:hypothetical protein
MLFARERAAIELFDSYYPQDEIATPPILQLDERFSSSEKRVEEGSGPHLGRI